jgi:hypothetical protein
MSVKKSALRYAAFAVVLAAILIAATTLYFGNSSIKTNSAQAVLAVQLTDPPQTPADTEWLNLTYTSVQILVGEPSGTTGQYSPTMVSVTPNSGSATIDLLALQNVSKTIASTNLPSGSIVYTVTLAVKSISINVNGTVSPVTVAGGTSNLQIVIAHPEPVQGTSAALLQLNPVVVDTPSGYQLIPSSVGIMRPQSEVNGNQASVGSTQTLTKEDQDEFQQAQGQLSVKVLALAVKGNTTILQLNVTNTGSVPVTLVAIGLHDSFNVTGLSCGDQQGKSHDQQSQQNEGDQSQASSSANEDSASGQDPNMSASVQIEADHGCIHPEEVVFLPLAPSSTAASQTSTTSSTTTTSGSTTITTTSTSQSSTSSSTAPVTSSCQTYNMTLARAQDSQENDNSQGDENQNQQGVTLQPGQCVILKFKGQIPVGESGALLVPNLSVGESFSIHIIASNNAETELSCTSPLSVGSCVQDTSNGNDG